MSQFGVSAKWPNVYVFGLWEDTRIPVAKAGRRTKGEHANSTYTGPRGQNDTRDHVDVSRQPKPQHHLCEE